MKHKNTTLLVFFFLNTGDCQIIKCPVFLVLTEKEVCFANELLTK